MKSLILLLFILIFSNFTTLQAQNYTFYGERTFGGNAEEYGGRLIKFSDKKLVIVGISNTLSSNGDKSSPNCNNNLQIGNNDMWAVMFEPDFTKIWDQRYGGEHGENGGCQIIKLSSNELMFSIRSNSDSICEKTENNWEYPLGNSYDYWICKIDTNGNKLWDKRFGSLASDNYPFIIKLSSSDLLVTGYSGNQINGDKTASGYGGSDLWAVKFDSLGTKIWDKSFGGAGAETHHVTAGNTSGLGVLATENGSFIIGGTTNSQMSGLVSGLGFGGRDIWVVKADSGGNYMWDNRFGGSTNNDYFGSFISTPDNGFIIVGSTGSPQGGSISDPQIGGLDVWVIKIDSLGNKQWDKRYGGVNEDYGISIAIAPDGGYWISADTESPQGFDVSEPPYGIRDYWIIKIDSVGNKLWDKRFGGPGYNYVSNFVIMPDSSIFLAGYADTGITAVKEDWGEGLSDYWVVHFEYSDNINTTAIEEINSINLKFYPNPTNTELNIHFTINNSANAEMQLFNSLGQLVKTIAKEKLPAGENRINISTEDLPAGIYYLQMKMKDKMVTKKVVKM